MVTAWLMRADDLEPIPRDETLEPFDAAKLHVAANLELDRVAPSTVAVLLLGYYDTGDQPQQVWIDVGPALRILRREPDGTFADLGREHLIEDWNASCSELTGRLFVQRVAEGPIEVSTQTSLAGDGCCNVICFDDGNACTNDYCEGGTCHRLVNCNDGNPCTQDWCDSDTGCYHPPQAGSCDDGLWCNGLDTCSDGSCRHTGDPCTPWPCFEDTDSCGECWSDAHCDDGYWCTGVETCDPDTRLCVDGPDPCPPSMVCDESQDACVACTSNGQCNDGDPCTNNVCADGVCTFPPKNCDDQNVCTTDWCDEGTCLHTGCDDGNPCTTDTCETWGCAYQWNACDDGNLCTWDWCDPDTGACIHEDWGGLCPEYSCPCWTLTGECDPESGCVWINHCDDGDPCTADGCAYHSISRCTEDDYCINWPLPAWAISSVQWIAVAGTPLDTNPNPGGGLRIFPGKTSPADQQDHRKVKVRAYVWSGEPGIPVYFRAFDVDDPSHTQPPVDDESLDQDNRGSPQTGSPATYVAYTTGDWPNFAEFEFTVTMQPGDNFRVGAAVCSNDLDGWHALKYDTLGRVVDANNQVVPANRITPMLTVWRKLHVETDSMVRPTFTQNTYTMPWNEPEVGDVPTQVRFDVDDPPAEGGQTDDQQFLFGYVELKNPAGNPIVTARVLDYESNEGPLTYDDWVLINLPDCGNGQSGLACLGGVDEGTAVLSDDDLMSQATFAAKVWGCDDVYAGGGSALLPPDLSALTSRYGEAYILPVHETSVSGTGGISTFIRNWQESQNNGRALWDQVLPIRALPVSTPQYWTVMVVSAWQAEENSDADPDVEAQSWPGTTLGVSTHEDGSTQAVPQLGSTYTGICAVFNAVTRGPNETDYLNPEPSTVAHEVGHTLGLPHNPVDEKDPPMGLMDPAGSGRLLPFTPENLRRLREYQGP